MNYTASIAFIALSALSSCASNVEKRIELLQNELHIVLPPDYEIIQDEDVTLEHIPYEYRMTLTLRFSQTGFESLVGKVHESPFFDQLHDYREMGSGVTITPEYAEIKDSLKSNNRRGGWIRDPNGYKFIDFFGPESMRPIKASVDSTMRTLTFEYIKI